MDTGKDRLFYIDLLRFCAILLITLYHVCRFIGFENMHMLKIFKTISMQGGWLGCCLFFFISGYCLSLHYNQDLKYKDFIKDRLIKIIPAYYIAMFIWYIIIQTSNGEICPKPVGLFDTVTHLFFIHNLFDKTFYSYSGVFWFLGTLFNFYLLFPFLYKLTNYFRYKILIFSFICLIISVLLSRYINTAVLHKSVLTYMPCFIFGIFTEQSCFSVNKFTKYVCMLTAIVLSFFAKQTHCSINILAIIQTIIISFSIILFKDAVYKIPTAIKNIISEIAKSSFSIYLYNYIFHIGPPVVINSVVILAYIISVFGFGYMMYLFVQKPFQKTNLQIVPNKTGYAGRVTSNPLKPADIQDKYR